MTQKSIIKIQNLKSYNIYWEKYQNLQLLEGLRSWACLHTAEGCNRDCAQSISSSGISFRRLWDSSRFHFGSVVLSVMKRFGPLTVISIHRTIECGPRRKRMWKRLNGINFLGSGWFGLGIARLELHRSFILMETSTELSIAKKFFRKWWLRTLWYQFLRPVCFNSLFVRSGQSQRDSQWTNGNSSRRTATWFLNKILPSRIAPMKIKRLWRSSSQPILPRCGGTKANTNFFRSQMGRFLEHWTALGNLFSAGVSQPKTNEYRGCDAAASRWGSKHWSENPDQAHSRTSRKDERDLSTEREENPFKLRPPSNLLSHARVRFANLDVDIRKFVLYNSIYCKNRTLVQWFWIEIKHWKTATLPSYFLSIYYMI